MIEIKEVKSIIRITLRLVYLDTSNFETVSNFERSEEFFRALEIFIASARRYILS